MPASSPLLDLSLFSDRLARQLGLRFSVGVELEFYLSSLRIARREVAESLRAEFAKPAYGGVTLAPETGSGQFEFRFAHRAELNDLTQLIGRVKAVVGGLASAPGDRPSFQSRPHFSLPGSGLHVNLSLRPIHLAGGGDAGYNPEGTIRHAVSGLLLTMRHGMVLFAPSVESYFRYRWQCDSPDYRQAGAPRTVSWGNNDRAAAIRVMRPAGAPDAWRIEHRVPGADADPAVAVAAVLAGAAAGIEAGGAGPMCDDLLDNFRIDSGRCPPLPRTLAESRQVWHHPLFRGSAGETPLGRLWAAVGDDAAGGVAGVFAGRVAAYALQR